MSRAQAILSLLEAKKIETPDELAQALEDTVKKIFPKSFVLADFTTRLGASITLRFLLGKDKSEWSNGIPENDPLKQSLSIWLDKTPATDSLPEKVTIENHGGSMTIKPQEGSRNAYDRIKLPWRKKTDTPEKIVAHVKTYFERVMKIYKDNKDQVPGPAANKY
jgi:hypothetical protein